MWGDLIIVFSCILVWSLVVYVTDYVRLRDAKKIAIDLRKQKCDIVCGFRRNMAYDDRFDNLKKQLKKGGNRKPLIIKNKYSIMLSLFAVVASMAFYQSASFAKDAQNAHFAQRS